MMSHGWYRLFVLCASASKFLCVSFRTPQLYLLIKLILPLLSFAATTAAVNDVHLNIHKEELHRGQNRDHGQNAAFNFVRGVRRPIPEKHSTSADELTSLYNKLKQHHQNVHPTEDNRRGQMRIQWSNDMFFLLFGRNDNAGPYGVRRSPHTSTGAPWPLPKRYARNDKTIFTVVKGLFRIVTNVTDCDVIDSAITRYTRRILTESLEDMYDNLQHAEESRLHDPADKYSSDLYRTAPAKSVLNVLIKKPCKGIEYPSLTSDESYYIIINSDQTVVVANEVWGALRGLETFSQLVWKGTDEKLYVMETIVIDKPRFSHRGIMIDTARHYIFKEVIFDVLDAMEMNKMNVLHWHIVDDQSFPFESKVFPELSKKGAYHPDYVYKQKDIEYIIEYARLRGIRVIPEFDVPGHTYSWGLSQPDLLARCYSKDYPQPGSMGPMDASRDETYKFLKTLFTEILTVFKDQFIHIGGDEVNVDCWEANEKIMKEGRKKYYKWKNISTVPRRAVPAGAVAAGAVPAGSAVANLSPFGSHNLWDYFQNRFMSDLEEIKKTRSAGLKYLMWQEAAIKTDLHKFANNTVAIIWFGDASLLREAIALGYHVLYTSCWYLDNISAGPDWRKYYNCDPAFPGSGVDETKVLGGEACLWAEYITNENLMVLLWPRASAAAERLWSTRDTKDVASAAPRLHEQRCRMLRRGLAVNHANGPDYCLRPGQVKGAKIRSNLIRVVTSETENLFQEIVIILQVIVILVLLAVVCRNRGFKEHVLKKFRHAGSGRILAIFVCVCGFWSLVYIRMWSYEFSNRTVLLRDD